MIISLFMAFFVKHFICDFPLQRWDYMYANKGIYGHMGGFLHAGIHGVGTFLTLVLFKIPVLIILTMSAFDLLVHYHIDWAKTKLCKHYNLKPDNSEWYWHLLGLGQFLHYLTYAGIIWVVR